MNGLTKEMVIIKTVYKFVLAGNWTSTSEINRVKAIEDIPRCSNHVAHYNPETNTTTLEISTTNFG